MVARAAAAAQVFVDDPSHPVLTDDDRHHLGRVLRLRPGETVVAADGRGRWAPAVWEGDGTLEPAGRVHVELRAEPLLTVVFAPAKGDRAEWVVQKLTELGVDHLVPLHSERSVVRWTAERGHRACARLRRVAREAAAQSRRVWLPDVGEIVSFADLVGLGSAGEVALAQLGGGPPTGAQHVVAVGPEGGWSDAELASGLPTVALGGQRVARRDGRSGGRRAAGRPAGRDGVRRCGARLTGGIRGAPLRRWSRARTGGPVHSGG